jgi:hypothetical protein
LFEKNLKNKMTIKTVFPKVNQIFHQFKISR